MATRSIVDYLGGHDGYRCGYCGSSSSNYSQGMWAYSLSVQDYQDLIDRGWRRSGKYCYKPTLKKTCCPQYTIRCNVVDFQLTKSQKKVLKRMQRFLTTGSIKNEKNTSEKQDDKDNLKMDCVEMSVNEVTLPENLQARIAQTKIDFPDNQLQLVEISNQQSEILQKTESKTENSISKRDPNKPPCRKAREIRRERRLQKLSKKNPQEAAALQTSSITNRKNNTPKTVEDFLTENQTEKPAHKLEIRLVRSSPRSVDFERSFHDSLTLYQKYQTNIHKDPIEKCSSTQYKHFLVDSSIKAVRSGGCEYGCFHQHYILDGEIIAVGVIDILPSCISSVYLYYNPDYSFLSLGTYSSLREMAFTRSLNKIYPNIKYYYMGFYIHSCPKMRYKGNYSPSFLLCPESFIWHPIEKCIPKLDLTKYSRFDETGADDEDGKIILDDVSIMYEHKIIPFSVYRQLDRDHSAKAVEDYAKLVGKKCSPRMLLYRS